MPEPNAHDRFFKELMARPEALTDFLTHYLPPELSAPLDVSQAEALPGSFVDEELREHHSDLLCRVKRKNGQAAR